jgi:hypothetical protein
VAEIPGEELEARVRELATATLIARHLPQIRNERSGEGGGRHDYAMALSGFLLRLKRLDEALVLKILKALCGPARRTARPCRRRTLATQLAVLLVAA